MLAHRAAEGRAGLLNRRLQSAALPLWPWSHHSGDALHHGFAIEEQQPAAGDQQEDGEKC